MLGTQTVIAKGDVLRVYRLDPKTGSKQYAHTEDGHYVLGDPKHGGRKHTKANKVLVRTEQEMIDLIHQGFSVRVITDTAPSLVRRNIFIDNKKIT